jgi:hypothetical protein
MCCIQHIVPTTGKARHVSLSDETEGYILIDFRLIESLQSINHLDDSGRHNVLD